MFCRSILLASSLVILSHDAFAADPIASPPSFGIGSPYGTVSANQSSYETTTELESWNSASGYLEGGYGKVVKVPNDLDTLGVDDIDSWGLRGSVNVGLNEGWNIQLDANYGRTNIEDVSVDGFAGAAHAYYRSDEGYALGAFAKASRMKSDDLSSFLSFVGVDDSLTDYAGGLEAAYMTDRATIYGNVGFGQADGLGLSWDHFMGGLGTRLYANDNLRFDIEGGLHRYSSNGADLDTRSIKVAADYRLEQAPIALTAGYRYDDMEVSGGGLSYSSDPAHSLYTRIRFSFGSDSLKNEERNGPLWTQTSLLP